MRALIPADALQAFARGAYERAGLSAEDAGLCADTLVQADLWDHPSHGVMRLPWYVARLRAAVCRCDARPEIVVDAGAVAVVDGHDGMGQVVAAKAAREAVDRARQHGVGAVAVRNSNHFGVAMYYTLMAARSECVAFLSTNASPAMAPWGGRTKMVGNNPWSWAGPAGRYPPLVLDVANTGVARGKIYVALQRGERIPLGWALDADGAPTTDPRQAIDGLILPMAGHKGYAISVAMDMLSGILSSSAFGQDVHGPYQAERRSGAGHFMLALDIGRFLPVGEFHRRMEQMIARLKSSPPAPGCSEVLYPGEREARCAVLNGERGLALPEAVVGELTQLAAELGIAFPHELSDHRNGPRGRGREEGAAT